MRAWRDYRRQHRARRKIAYSPRDREEMVAIRIRLDEGSWRQYRGLQYCGLNIATLQKVIVAERAYYGGSQCHIDPECHVDNIALIRIAHYDDKADNDQSDLRAV
jgi:hypothetical protein